MAVEKKLGKPGRKRMAPELGRNYRVMGQFCWKDILFLRKRGYDLSMQDGTAISTARVLREAVDLLREKLEAENGQEKKKAKAKGRSRRS